MPAQELSGTTALVTGASRGFGRAIAAALSKHGAHVAGVARDHGRLEELRGQLSDAFTPVAAAPVVAGHLLDQHRPRTLILTAGAAPLPRPIHRQTWQTFSRNWELDVQHVFNRTREALLRELLSRAQVRPRTVPRHHASHHDRRGAAARTAHVRTTPRWPSSTPESRSA